MCDFIELLSRFKAYKKATSLPKYLSSTQHNNIFSHQQSNLQIHIFESSNTFIKMYFSKTILALALAASPIFALPVEESSNDIVARAGSYSCKPKDNKSNIKTFTISEDRVNAQAKIAMYKAGKSGDPHHYGNGDNIKWGVKGCNKKGTQLYECKSIPRHLSIALLRNEKRAQFVLVNTFGVVLAILGSKTVSFLATG